MEREWKVISKEEVLQTATKHDVNPVIIEKDYVLGWILAGISNNPTFSDSWIFKGGTCLKKCYFKEYRFSEDLDFTLTEQASTDPSFIREKLSDVTHWLYENGGIEVPEIIVDLFPDSNGKILRGKMGYVGPLEQRASYTRIKLDLSQDEFLAMSPMKMHIYHPYGDREDFLYQTNAYTYEELFAEKIRALFERARPRDLYDVINLFERQNDHGLDKNVFMDIAQRKLKFRGLAELSQETELSPIQKKEMIDDWEKMLAHQIGHLDSIDAYLNKLPKILSWLNG